MNLSFPEDQVDVRLDDPGATILQVSIANKIPHLRECGGHGLCTTCRVQILDGINHVSERTAREAQIAEERGWDPYTRLACQTRITGDVTVRRLIRTPADVSLIQTDAFQANQGREVHAAILMCDIRQFTPFVDSHLPYDVYHILNRFFGEIGEPILLNDGFIYQYVGDQIVGLFGLQGATAEEACLSAVRAGFGIIHALQNLNEQVEEEFGVRLGIRLGAHYGPLVVGYMGHPTRLDFSVVGDAINVASRIENANESLGTTFLVSEMLYDHVQIDVETGFRGNISLKGKEGRHTLIEMRGFTDPNFDLIIQETARLILGDQERFAGAFYRRLFEKAPAARDLFKGDMKLQGHMLAHTLQMAVYGLSRFRSTVTGLAALGKSHVDYGVFPEHYDLFEQVFLETSREILGERYDASVERAWSHAIGRICDVMRRSAKSGANKGSSPQTSSGPQAAVPHTY